MDELANRRALKEKQNEPAILEGEAVCLWCDHRWIAISEVGCTWLECPRCSRVYGRTRHPVVRDNPGRDDSTLWVCLCGCDVFRICLEGTYCIDCGTFDDHPD